MMVRQTRNTFLLGTLVLAISSQIVVAQAPAPAPPAVAGDKDALFKKVEKAILASSLRRLTAGKYTPWQIVHGVLAFKHDFILKDPDKGPKATISGIEWMASGVLHEGQPLWEKTPYGGRGHPFTHPYAFEGHPTQFMGYMSMCDLPLDFKFKTGASGEITVRDIINDAKMQLREGPEVTWTLWALAHYIPPDSEWVNAYGEAWSIERLVQIQTNESVYSAACGGTHGLFALAYARNRYIATRKPIRGVWLEADMKIRRFIAEAKTMQNPDGSFSSNYFQSREQSSDFPKRLPANGHMLEWLMVALPQQELQSEWITRAVDSVATDLLNNRSAQVDCGPLFHAVHSLVLYNFRMNPNAKPLAYPLTGKGRLEATVTAMQTPKELPKEAPKADAPKKSEPPKAGASPTETPKSEVAKLEMAKTEPKGEPSKKLPEIPKAASVIPPQHNKTIGILDIEESDDDKVTGDLIVPNPPKTDAPAAPAPKE
ncbi:MAG: hypothetical protein U0903_10480 [Planctomycetales bacterium]